MRTQSSASAGGATAIDLRLLARWQRFLLLSFLAFIVGIIFLTAAGAMLTSGWLLHFGISLIPISVLSSLLSVLNIMSLMRLPILLRILCTPLMFIPFANMIVMLLLNGAASRKLQSAGIRVGVLGGNQRDAARAMNASLCIGCGYNLYGNLSGRCPECGKAIAATE